MTRTETQGERLSRLARERGMNLTQLGQRAGVARETVSKIANDKRPLGPRVAVRLAGALGVSPGDLVLTPAEDTAGRRNLDLRLRALEEAVPLLAAGLDALAREVRALALRLDDGDGRASRAR